MDQTKTIALFVATALFTSAGLAAASGALTPRSIWGDDNPGQGNEHAAMPVAASEHNQAGEHDGDDGDDEQDDNHDDEETGDDDEEIGDDDEGAGDDEEEAGDDDEETGDDDAVETSALRELMMIVPLSVNNTEHNWSRNWTHGNITCSGSGNKTSGTITCSWGNYTFSFWGLNCTISAGSFTKTWSPGNVTWNRTGGDIACTWSWPSHSSSSGSSSTAQADSRP
jgi:hypothetical protein